MAHRLLVIVTDEMRNAIDNARAERAERDLQDVPRTEMIRDLIRRGLGTLKQSNREPAQ